MINIVSEYPLWFIIFCILLGALYAYILYLAGSKELEIGKWLKRILFSLRLIAVTIISFLLLSPLLKTIFRYIEKPVIIIAQDNSKSIITNKDSAFYKTDYLKLLDEFKDKLSKNFDIKYYTFGSNVYDAGARLQRVPLTPNSEPRTIFSEQQTDISDLFSTINNLYSNRNVGAIVLATDGIYNKGTNPLYASANISSQIYTVALGDTNYRKDIILKKINYNKTAYLGNTFPVEVVIAANKCKGSRTKLTVANNNETVFTKDIDISSDLFNQVVSVQLEAKKSGIQFLKINLSPVNDEISISNNTADIFIEVLNNKEKILILASSPHPDISAIRQALESNLNYQVDAFIINDFNKNIADYNLVILHQLPSVNDPAYLIISSILKSETPVLYIIGNNSSLPLFNNLKAGITIPDSRLAYNEALPVSNPEFPLFTVSNDLWNMINSFPPLLSPFGTYKVQNSSNVFLYQKIGTVSTKTPLILFNRAGNIRNGVIAGEGIWKWNLTNFLQKNNHDIFNQLINKIVQYLTIRVDKSRFRIISPNSFMDNEPISFDAEVFNDSYELINDPDINMTISNKDNKKFPFVFSKTTNAYHLDAGAFPQGIYKYFATVKVGDNVYNKEGEFSISGFNIETVNTVADHSLLYNISKKHNGKMFYPRQLSELAETINKQENIKPVSYTQFRFSDIINLYWVFFLIIALLSAEWFIRKYTGNY